MFPAVAVAVGVTTNVTAAAAAQGIDPWYMPPKVDTAATAAAGVGPCQPTLGGWLVDGPARKGSPYRSTTICPLHAYRQRQQVPTIAMVEVGVAAAVVVVGRGGGTPWAGGARG